jgi:hypothetical protein
MTASPAAIAGTYADLRQVKSRGVWQLVIDVPPENAEKLVKLFGLPRQDELTWLAVARLNVPPGASTGAANGSVAPPAPPSLTKPAGAPGGATRKRTLPEKVGMRCNDERFQEWLHSSMGRVTANAEDAAYWVRGECGVKSRAEILPGTEAAKRWLALEAQYMQQTGQFAEERL